MKEAEKSIIEGIASFLAVLLGVTAFGSNFTPTYLRVNLSAKVLVTKSERRKNGSWTLVTWFKVCSIRQQSCSSSRVGNVLNTAFIERLSETIHERLASLTCKRGHTASRLQALHKGTYLIGCTCNFCLTHHELREGSYLEGACISAMASG